ncbi:uncharacterized protein LOC113360180 [Papaver somniferum]|uniref:uncharacterized protein LOC113360180 n=1 Tax=Papaver somniferum TaxID=3469 RepID=UPI000E6FA57F|nr:uncharacterized protein LOC113360180 [Papaver somniferum]
MKSVMPSIISDVQGAFMQGRQIHDGIPISSELINSILTQQLTGIICKVDFEKAFDNVNWGCVDNTLDIFCFGSKWKNWCISTPRFVVLIKGEATNLFRSEKGIRQGDPISPFLFILVAEVLSLMFKSAAARNLVSGFKVAPQGDDSLCNLLFYTQSLPQTLNILLGFPETYLYP